MTDVIKRDDAGRFLPGASPKSPGRPRGKSQSELVRRLLEPHRKDLIERALALTTNGDPFAAANGLRICLERLAPAPKQEPEKVVVPGLAAAATFGDKCQSIIAAVAAGQISAESAEKLLRMIDVFRRAVELDDHERRIKLLEERGLV